MKFEIKPTWIKLPLIVHHIDKKNQLLFDIVVDVEKGTLAWIGTTIKNTDDMLREQERLRSKKVSPVSFTNGYKGGSLTSKFTKVEIDKIEKLFKQRRDQLPPTYYLSIDSWTELKATLRKYYSIHPVYSFWQRIFKGMIGLFKFHTRTGTIKGGDVKEISRRLSECLVCEFNKDAKCQKCGCAIQKKVLITKESCPIEKW